MIPQRRRRVPFLIATVALAAANSGAAQSTGMTGGMSAPVPAVSPFTVGFGSEVHQGFERVRAVTAPFASLDSAVAAGYARDVPQCIADGHHGAMGFHHVNRGFIDARVEVEKPEILVYERHPDGRYALNGVEYIIPYRLWSRDSIAPTIMGQNLKRADDLNLWYLHMWVWTRNTAGLFADWNPAVKCPE